MVHSQNLLVVVVGLVIRNWQNSVFSLWGGLVKENPASDKEFQGDFSAG